MFPCHYTHPDHADLMFPAYSEFAARALIWQMVQEGRTEWGGNLTLMHQSEAVISQQVKPEDAKEEARLSVAAKMFFDQED